jgi:hypothetical protein
MKCGVSANNSAKVVRRISQLSGPTRVTGVCELRACGIIERQHLYCCNMAWRNEYRRNGDWNFLKALTHEAAVAADVVGEWP